MIFLREELIKYYIKIGLQISLDDIIITNGASEAIQFALFCTCDSNDEIIIFEPFYPNYRNLIVQRNIKIVPITTTIETEFQIPYIKSIENNIKEKTKGIIICNPCNPTGRIFNKKELLEIGNLCKKYNLYLYVDETYKDFCYNDNNKFFSSINLSGLENNIILIDSLSMRFNLGGARIGCLISKNLNLMNSVMKLAQARLCSPFLGQILAENALKAPSEYFESIKKEYKIKRDFVYEKLSSIKGIQCNEPMGTFFIIAELPVEDSTEFSKWVLEEFEYEKSTIKILPLYDFYSSKNLGKKQVRISFSLNLEEVKYSMKCLEIALNKYPGKSKEKAYVISVCGAGGKTTFVKNKAIKYGLEGKKVCVTTTTHMLKEDSRPQYDFIGKEIEGYKIGYVGDEEYKKLCEKYDTLVIEADGSRKMPIKIPKLEREPVIPSNTKEIYCLFGMAALGRKISAVCHRYDSKINEDMPEIILNILGSYDFIFLFDRASITSFRTKQTGWSYFSFPFLFSLILLKN